MKCPYCGRDMNIGYLFSERKPNQWIPANKKPPIWVKSVTADGVKLNNKSGMTGHKATAYYCNNCKIVIAPTEE